MVEILRADEFAEGPRRTQAEFDTPSHQLLRASIDRRPDAVSFDYLWSFAYGPVAISDVSAGIRDRPWYVRCEGLDVYIARANDANDGWEAETLLFSYTGAAIVELDLAFEQAGRAVVVAERPTGTAGAPELWIYWFDPMLGFVFQNFGEGRTPRCILDEPDFTSESDVLVFYINDTDDEVKMRVQREEYATDHAVPITDVAEKFLEDVVKVSDSRIRVVASVRDAMAGTYTLESLESTLYPIAWGPDEVASAMTFLTSLLDQVVIEVGYEGPVAYIQAEDEEVLAAMAFVGALVALAIITIDQDTDPRLPADPEEVAVDMTFVAALVALAVIIVEQETDPRLPASPEEVNGDMVFVAALLDLVVIVVEQETAARLPGGTEEVDGTMTFVSALLETV